MSPFPTLPPPEQTPESLLGSIPRALRETTEYHVPAITRPKDANARLTFEHIWYAHEAIGGAPALAIWASQNRLKFYTYLLARALTPDASLSAAPTVIKLAVPVKQIDMVPVKEPLESGREGG